MYPIKGLPYFCNDVEGQGWTWHATEAEALAEAARCIAEWQGEEWPPEAEAIYVGQVTHRSRQVNKTPCAEGCHDADDWHCDIAMRVLDATQEPWSQQEPTP